MVNLYLDNELIDLSEESTFDLTYACANIDKLEGGNVRGTFSYEINLPATNRNKKLFFFPELILEDSFDDAIEKTAKLEIGGNLILNGFARIKNTIINNSIVSYSVILYEGNAGWISQIKDKDITDLSNIADFDHVYTRQNMALSDWKANNLPYAYPVINFGENQKGVNEWSVEDRYPAFSFYWVYNQIFEDIGYSIESNFINSDFFQRLYFTADKVPERSIEDLRPHKFNVRHSQPIYNTYKVPLYLSQNGDNIRYNVITRVPFNNAEPSLAYHNTENNDVQFGTGAQQGTFFCNFKGKMSFTLNYAFTWFKDTKLRASKEIEIELFLYRYTVATNRYTIIEQRLLSLPKAMAGITNPPDFMGEFTTESIEVNPNEHYYFAFRLITETNNGHNLYLSDETNTFKNNVFSSLVEGSNIVMADVMPEIKQKDFIADVRTMFNLYFYTDELAKKIYIEPRDEFYEKEAIDWSLKIDKSKNKVISHLGDSLGDEIIFQYSNDSNDKYIAIEEKKKDEPYLSLSVDNTNKNGVDGKTKIQVNSFATTYIGKGITTASSALIPIIWDSESFEIPKKKVDKWKPRVLYNRDPQPLPSGQYWRFEGVNYNYFPSFTTNYVNGSYSNKHVNSLDFDSFYFARGLYEKHWKNTIDTINQSRKVEMYLYLTSTDILNLNFRTPIFINEQGDINYYHLETIHNFNGQIRGSFKCTFIKVVNPTPIADWIPAEGAFLTPPYIQDTVIVEETQEDIQSVFNMKLIFPIWQSTAENPSGEFIDTEYNTKIRRVRPNGEIRGGATNDLKLEL